MNGKEYSTDEVHWVLYCEKRMTIVEGLLQRLDSQLSDLERGVLVEAYRQHEAALVELGVIPPADEVSGSGECPMSEQEEDEIAYP